MKRWLAWVFVLVCILSGCADQPDETVPTTESTKPKSTQPPHSLLWAGSAAETATNGAVKLYAPDAGIITGLIFLDGDPVVLAAQDDVTYLTRFDSATGNVKTSTQCSGTLYSSLGIVVAKDSRLVCFDPMQNEFRLLDGTFKELDNIKLKDDLTGGPIISRDLTTAYYVQNNEVRAIDLQTGISRIVSQMNAESIYLMNLVFDDSVLCCAITDEESSYVVFLNAENGVTLATDADLMKIHSQADAYLATRLDAATVEVLTGQRGDTVKRFTPAGDGQPLLLPAGILEPEQTATGSSFSLYSLVDGKRVAHLQLDGIYNVIDIVQDPSDQYIWIMAQMKETGESVLCRWEIVASDGGDEMVRIGTRFTAEKPDAEGIARCQQRAKELSEKYGVQIHLANDVIAAENYTFTNEFQVDAFESALDDLDSAMAKYPEDFFKIAAGSVTKDGVIHIGLIRAYKANTLNAQIQRDGLQYWIKGKAYIALCVGDQVEQNFHNEMCHAVETHVRSYSIHYDFWADCNPEGFQYDESYANYMAHANSPYLQDATRAFIDAYSMTYAHEDRARVMEYAMMDGNAHYFETDVMQAKLKQLCLGLRQAFGWIKHDGTFLWEQYLKESLAYTEEE